MADKQTKKAMSEEMAQQEFYNFLKGYKRKIESIEEVSTKHANIIDALVDGSLQLGEVPVYTLMHPIKGAESTTVLYDKIEFKTRISPNTIANLMKGVDTVKDRGTWSLILMSHITGLASRKEVDLFHPFDFEVINEMAGVFM